MNITEVNQILDHPKYQEVKLDYQERFICMKQTYNESEDIQDLFEKSLEAIYEGEHLRLNCTWWFDECLDNDGLEFRLKGQTKLLGSVELALKSRSYLELKETIDKLNARVHKPLDELREYAEEFIDYRHY